MTTLEFLVRLGFSIEEAVTRVRNIKFEACLKAALTEASIWTHQLTKPQADLLILLSYKAERKMMRYFLHLAEAIANERIKDSRKSGFAAVPRRAEKLLKYITSEFVYMPATEVHLKLLSHYIGHNLISSSSQIEEIVSLNFDGSRFQLRLFIYPRKKKENREDSTVPQCWPWPPLELTSEELLTEMNETDEIFEYGDIRNDNGSSKGPPFMHSSTNIKNYIPELPITSTVLPSEAKTDIKRVNTFHILPTFCSIPCKEQIIEDATRSPLSQNENLSNFSRIAYYNNEFILNNTTGSTEDEIKSSNSSINKLCHKDNLIQCNLVDTKGRMDYVPKSSEIQPVSERSFGKENIKMTHDTNQQLNTNKNNKHEISTINKKPRRLKYIDIIEDIRNDIKKIDINEALQKVDLLISIMKEKDKQSDLKSSDPSIMNKLTGKNLPFNIEAYNLVLGKTEDMFRNQRPFRSESRILKSPPGEYFYSGIAVKGDAPFDEAMNTATTDERLRPSPILVSLQSKNINDAEHICSEETKSTNKNSEIPHIAQIPYRTNHEAIVMNIMVEDDLEIVGTLRKSNTYNQEVIGDTANSAGKANISHTMSYDDQYIKDKDSGTPDKAKKEVDNHEKDQISASNKGSITVGPTISPRTQNEDSRVSHSSSRKDKNYERKYNNHNNEGASSKRVNANPTGSNKLPSAKPDVSRKEKNNTSNHTSLSSGSSNTNPGASDEYLTAKEENSSISQNNNQGKSVGNNTTDSSGSTNASSTDKQPKPNKISKTQHDSRNINKSNTQVINSNINRENNSVETTSKSADVTDEHQSIKDQDSVTQDTSRKENNKQEINTINNNKNNYLGMSDNNQSTIDDVNKHSQGIEDNAAYRSVLETAENTKMTEERNNLLETESSNKDTHRVIMNDQIDTKNQASYVDSKKLKRVKYEVKEPRIATVTKDNNIFIQNLEDQNGPYKRRITVYSGKAEDIQAMKLDIRKEFEDQISNSEEILGVYTINLTSQFRKPTSTKNEHKLVPVIGSDNVKKTNPQRNTKYNFFQFINGFSNIITAKIIHEANAMLQKVNNFFKHEENLKKTLPEKDYSNRKSLERKTINREYKDKDDLLLKRQKQEKDRRQKEMTKTNNNKSPLPQSEHQPEGTVHIQSVRQEKDILPERKNRSHGHIYAKNKKSSQSTETESAKTEETKSIEPIRNKKSVTSAEQEKTFNYCICDSCIDCSVIMGDGAKTDVNNTLKNNAASEKQTDLSTTSEKSYNQTSNSSRNNLRERDVVEKTADDQRNLYENNSVILKNGSTDNSSVKSENSPAQFLNNNVDQPLNTNNALLLKDNSKQSFDERAIKSKGKAGMESVDDTTGNDDLVRNETDQSSKRVTDEISQEKLSNSAMSENTTTGSEKTQKSEINSASISKKQSDIESPSKSSDLSLEESILNSRKLLKQSQDGDYKSTFSSNESHASAPGPNPQSQESRVPYGTLTQLETKKPSISSEESLLSKSSDEKSQYTTVNFIKLSSVKSPQYPMFLYPMDDSNNEARQKFQTTISLARNLFKNIRNDDNYHTDSHVKVIKQKLPSMQRWTNPEEYIWYEVPKMVYYQTHVLGKFDERQLFGEVHEEEGETEGDEMDEDEICTTEGEKMAGVEMDDNTYKITQGLRNNSLNFRKGTISHFNSDGKSLNIEKNIQSTQENDYLIKTTRPENVYTKNHKVSESQQTKHASAIGCGLGSCKCTCISTGSVLDSCDTTKHDKSLVGSKSNNSKTEENSTTNNYQKEHDSENDKARQINLDDSEVAVTEVINNQRIPGDESLSPVYEDRFVKNGENCLENIEGKEMDNFTSGRYKSKNDYLGSSNRQMFVYPIKTKKNAKKRKGKDSKNETSNNVDEIKEDSKIFSEKKDGIENDSIGEKSKINFAGESSKMIFNRPIDEEMKLEANRSSLRSGMLVDSITESISGLRYADSLMTENKEIIDKKGSTKFKSSLHVSSEKAKKEKWFTKFSKVFSKKSKQKRTAIIMSDVGLIELHVADTVEESSLSEKFSGKEEKTSFTSEVDENFQLIKQKSFSVEDQKAVVAVNVVWPDGTPDEIIELTKRKGTSIVRPIDITQTLQQGFRRDCLSLSRDFEDPDEDRRNTTVKLNNIYQRFYKMATEEPILLPLGSENQLKGDTQRNQITEIPHDRDYVQAHAGKTHGVTGPLYRAEPIEVILLVAVVVLLLCSSSSVALTVLAGLTNCTSVLVLFVTGSVTNAEVVSTLTRLTLDISRLDSVDLKGTEDTDTPACWANFERDLLGKFSKRLGSCKLCGEESGRSSKVSVNSMPEVAKDTVKALWRSTANQLNDENALTAAYNVSSYKSSDDEGADSLSTLSSSSRVGSTCISSSESDSDNEICDEAKNRGRHKKDFRPKQEQHLGHSGLNTFILRHNFISHLLSEYGDAWSGSDGMIPEDKDITRFCKTVLGGSENISDGKKGSDEQISNTNYKYYLKLSLQIAAPSTICVGGVSSTESGRSAWLQNVTCPSVSDSKIWRNEEYWQDRSKMWGHRRPSFVSVLCSSKRHVEPSRGDSGHEEGALNMSFDFSGIKSCLTASASNNISSANRNNAPVDEVNTEPEVHCRSVDGGGCTVSRTETTPLQKGRRSRRSSENKRPVKVGIVKSRVSVPPGMATNGPLADHITPVSTIRFGDTSLLVGYCLRRPGQSFIHI
ncbi:hypothetical protein C0J52_07734 [Blattella germanica]|nr:hypothetical protein C0J52_07734 [Blattella germanica]